MRLIKRPKSLGYIPGPRPRLPDEPEESRLRSLVWILLIIAAVAVVVLFGKKGG